MGILEDLSSERSSLLWAFCRNVIAGELSWARENASLNSVSVHNYNTVPHTSTGTPLQYISYVYKLL